MHASVMTLLIFINTLMHTSDKACTKLNEWHDVIDKRPDYLTGGSRTTSSDLYIPLWKGVDRTVAHHCVNCSEYQLLQCTVATVTVHTITIVRSVTVDEGCTYSLGSSCNQPIRVTSFIRRVAHKDRPFTRDRLYTDIITDIITDCCSLACLSVPPFHRRPAESHYAHPAMYAWVPSQMAWSMCLTYDV